MKYLHYFETATEYNQERIYNYNEPWGSYTEGQGIKYNKTEEEQIIESPLTFEITTSGTIKWQANNASSSNVVIQYKKNNGSWTSISSSISSSAPTISVASGDIIQFRGDNSAYGNGSNYNSFAGTCKFIAKGNIMSLIDSINFSTLTTFASGTTYNFNSLFNNCTGIVSAEHLILPATTLTGYCYGNMFQGCSNLTTPPRLPATTLNSFCYTNMFGNCSNLTTAPDLPARTLADGCYNVMFQSCSKLTTAPDLPATVLTSNCYYGMFRYCSKLKYVKAMFIDLTSATYDWLKSVASGGTFVKNVNATWTDTGTNAVPSGWTVQTATE